MKHKTSGAVHKFLSTNGRKGGLKKSDAKTSASALNAVKARKARWLDKPVSNGSKRPAKAIKAG